MIYSYIHNPYRCHTVGHGVSMERQALLLCWKPLVRPFGSTYQPEVALIHREQQPVVQTIKNPGFIRGPCVLDVLNLSHLNARPHALGWLI
jgi:hypothetical protein